MPLLSGPRVHHRGDARRAHRRRPSQDRARLRESLPHGALDDDALAELATLALRTLHRVLQTTGNADYNLVVREASLRHQREPWALWHLEILPRRGGDAGFEPSSGLYRVLVSPEESAATLRAL